MSWFGNWFGATATSGSSGIAFPAITQATTREIVRDRVMTVIEAISPTHQNGQRFLRYRNEGQADFAVWCESNPPGAFRRFQVRDLGDEDPPEVSNTDYERRIVKFQLLVAYPQTSRYGINGALDRDDVADEDFGLINTAIGWVGKPNFTFASDPIAIPDATPLGAFKEERVIGRTCDFLLITVSFLYIRNILG